MTKLQSLKEAADYIAERYVFNQQNYPILARLNGIEEKVFAVNHSVLLMLKSAPGFETTWFLLNVTGNFYFQDVEEHKANCEEAMVKMLINAIKLLEVVGLSSDEISLITQQDHSVNGSTLLILLSDIAAQCESFDHGGKFNMEKVKQSAISILQLILAGLNYIKSTTPCNQVPLQFSEAVDLIPHYMKSK